MTEEERKIFWKLDEKLYLVDKNKTYKKLFSSIDIWNINNISQSFINKLIAWYILKYDVKYIDSIINNELLMADYYLNDIMDFDKLRYRIDDTIKKLSNTDNLKYQYLVIMAGWGIIYDKNSNPEYGLYRVKEMFNDFNSYYKWNLNINIYDNVINRDYSLNNPEIIKLIEKKNKEIEINEKNKLPKIKRLFRR